MVHATPGFRAKSKDSGGAHFHGRGRDPNEETTTDLRHSATDPTG
jgi:hypothetical protein